MLISGIGTHLAMNNPSLSTWCDLRRKLEGELGPLPYEGPPRAGRQIPVGTGREVPPEVLDSLRGLNRQQLTNMLINYYHSIRGARRRTFLALIPHRLREDEMLGAPWVLMGPVLEVHPVPLWCLLHVTLSWMVCHGVLFAQGSTSW